MPVEFRLLGSVEARVDGQPATIGYAQLQGVLAVLLVEANRPVPVDVLLERVWGTRRLPRHPRAAVQHCVTLLRKALDVTIGWRSAGYELTVDRHAVDLHRFHDLIGKARAAGGDEPAADLLTQALALWRGEPFAGLDTPWFDAARDSLARLHLSARLDLLDVELRRGRHAVLLAELADLTDRYPLDERLACQHLLALYRSGRQAQALEHYEHLRRRLAEQLGADPSQPLRRLHQQILNADPALAAPAVAPAASPAPEPARPAVVPRQLPAAPRLFTGRDRELARLTAVLDEQGTVVISAIGGTGGIGKTWLALRWAYQHLDRFPDGQLHVNLRGFDPSGEPVPPGTAVRGFLEALGADPGTVPADLDAQSALYRGMVAGRRMLVVLDNARDAAQVEPLLPGGRTCTVLVTSRHQLTGLVTAHGAHRLDLDVLTEREARQLFASRLGSARFAAEPGPVAELLAWCAGLPLAISIVAARAGAHPDFPLSVFADELRDHTARLDALDGGDPATSLRAVLSWSYRALPAEAATMFELLGLVPGPDASLPATAALTALPAPRVRQVLRALEGTHLVQQHRPGRYRMHDLIRLYAAEQAARNQPGGVRDAALRRLADWYLHTALACDRLLDPQRRPIPVDAPATGCHVEPPEDATAALAWFTAEHPNLLAVQRLAARAGWRAHVWQLAWALTVFHRWQGRLGDALAMWRTALAVLGQPDGQLGGPLAQLRVHQGLGDTYALLGRHDEALPHLRQALTLAERADDLIDQAIVRQLFSNVWAQLGDKRLALEHDLEGLRLARTADEPSWEATALNSVGWSLAQLGEHERARAHCEAALALFQRHPDREGEAATLDSLGYIAHHTGQYTEARDYYLRALALYRELGDAYQEADTLANLGHTHSALGLPSESRADWKQAVELYRAQRRTADVDRLQQQLDVMAPG